ncbi:MAG: hypothetical protein JOZ47_17185 [Kutzneria sp.]|nr:hypothetical protein [Kutzneria sp.]MBV9846779.1 hypothetical protein [Kutzneria sp.]
MAVDQPFPPGTRRAPRPTEVLPCAACGELAGRGYPTCRPCTEFADRLWLVDWQALLAAEQVGAEGADERRLAEQVLAGEVGRYPWTCTDWAMSLVRCPACGAELGTGVMSCLRCRIADEARWAWDHAGRPVRMTGNEHALRVARTVLRAPHRQRETIVHGWRLALPFLLIGESPRAEQARRIRAYVLAKRYEELAECHSLAEMARLPGVPWRTGGPDGR